MFLEIDRIDLQSIHPNLQTCVELYRSNQPVEAMASAMEGFRKPTETKAGPDDWLVAGTLAQTCGLHARSRALYRFGVTNFPEDTRLRVLYAWEVSAQARDQACKRLLKETDAKTAFGKAMVHAVSCYNHSNNRWNDTAMKHHDRALKLAGNDPLVAYILSRAARNRREWDLTIKLCQVALSTQPRWGRARAALFDAHLCVGDIDQAANQLDPTAGDLRHIFSDFSQTVYLEISDRREEAIAKLDELVNYYPSRARLTKFCTRQLVLLLMKMDRIDAAREIMQRFSIKGFEEWEKLLTDDPRKTYISMPMLAQTRDHCVPTVAAMVASAQGFETTPNALATTMDTRNGTPLWRMVDAMRDLGFHAVCVKPEIEIVEKMLAQGVPLIGEQSGVFSGHVDTLCGFNAALQLIHMRDPMHWFSFSISYEALEKRYRSTCSLWALIPPDRVDSVTVESAWRNLEAEALIDLSRAVATGHRLMAEEAYQKIDDEHPLGLSRDYAARDVVLTSRQTDARLKQEIASISPDEEITTEQIRSMLSAMDEENADHIYEIAKANSEQLSRDWIRYVYTQVLYTKMKWKEAEKHLTQQTRSWPGMESLWSQLANVKEELGKLKEARKCLDIALEIAPDREFFQTKNIDNLKLQIPFEERLKRHTEIENKFPNSPRLKLSRASLLADCANGSEYERCLRECIRFFPRNAWAYDQLSNWYLLQDRSDLARQCMAEGRALIGEEELPICSWEQVRGQSEEGADLEDGAAGTAKPENRDEGEADNSQQMEQGDDDSSELTSTTARFRRDFLACYQKQRELSHDEFQKLPVLISLKESDAQHKFNWQQSTQLLTMQLANLLSDQSDAMIKDEDRRVTALDSILPDNVPGIPELFVDAVLDQLSLESSSKRVVQVIYAWAHRLTPNSSGYPNLEFQKAYLLELQLKLNEAEQVLSEVVATHPFFVVGWYRLGQLQVQRLEYRRAFETFQKCLEIQPGHYGAISELIRLAHAVDGGSHAKYTQALSERLPYSNKYLFDAAYSLVDEDDCRRAIKMVDRRKPMIGDSAHAIVAGRVYTDAGHHQRALELIDLVTIADIDQYAAGWVFVDCCVQLERYDEAESRLSELEVDYPHDRDIVDQKARLLRHDNVQKAIDYANEKIRSGMASSLLAYIDLTRKISPAEHAIGVLESLSSDHRDQTAQAYHYGIAQLNVAKERIKFLEYCERQFPHLTELRKDYVYVLGTNSKTKASIEVARRLKKDEPNNPEWLSLLGWAVQDVDPKESIELLKEEFAMTDSVDTLAQLARGYQLAGENQKAIDAYERVLVRNPNHTIAITNLNFAYSRNGRDLLDCVLDTIEKSLVGSSDQYFLVLAVKLALLHKTQLPGEWIRLAGLRFEQLKVESAFRDEQPLLRRAIIAWFKARDEPNPFFRPTLSERLFGQFRWPGAKWVPQKADSA